MRPDFELSQVVGESADRLISSQVFMSGGGADPAVRNTNQFLYEAARARQGSPLTYLAARGLIERVQRRDTVVVCAGFFDPPSMITEGDGPIGAALLGRALAAALDATPVFLTEVTNIPRMTELIRATGLDVVPLELARTTSFKASIIPLPIDRKRAEIQAQHMVDTVQPAAMISIEKPSPSSAGSYHTGPGLDVSAVVGKVDYFVNAAQRSGALTIGIGDGGNEVGMGLIAEDVRAIVSTGGIIGSSVSTDILVVGTIANWGAYAVEACLAAALHLPEVIHSVEIERRVVDAAARVGMIDPMSGMAHGWVDGTPPICSESILELLRYMVELRLDRKVRPHGLLGNGQRWHQDPSCEDQIRLWARHLSAEETAYFAQFGGAAAA